VILINPENSETIKIEQVRTFVKELSIKPLQSPSKLAIINQAQLLTPAAQHALLKTLEEPPEYALIILTADNPQHLLETILSRCSSSQRPAPRGTAERNAQHFCLQDMILTTPAYRRLKLTDRFSQTRLLAIEFCARQRAILHHPLAT